MEKLYLSRYTYFTLAANGAPLLYNSRNGIFLQLPSAVYEKLNSAKENNQTLDELDLDDSICNILKEKQIFLPKEEDEFYHLQEIYNYNIQSYASKTLSVTLAPTIDCNFACPYCYEEYKKKSYMDDATIESFITFVKEYQGCNELFLTWYGGEPLLAFNIMKKIAKQLAKIDNMKWKSHSIVTNGYLINEEILNFFEEYHLDNIQLTLDGSKEHHNLKRFEKHSKEGSFDIIVENIGKVLKKLPNTKVDIRVNIDKTNYLDFKYISNFLYSRYKENSNNLNIYPGFIRKEDKQHKCWGCESLVGNEKCDFFYDLHENSNIKVSFLPIKRHKGCIATNLHGYVIGPKGDIYKCWNDIGDSGRCCGYLSQKQYTNKTLVHKYMVDGNGLNDPECLSCFCLPICNLGCAWERLENKYNGGHYQQCSLYKNEDTLKKCLDLHYNKKKDSFIPD